MPETFLCWNADDDPKREAVPWAVRTKDARTAVESYAESRWNGDEDESIRVGVGMEGMRDFDETYLVRVEMVPRFVASKEG